MSKRPNGKVSRLPFEIRTQLNSMIRDGITYKNIISNLGDATKHRRDAPPTMAAGADQHLARSQAAG